MEISVNGLRVYAYTGTRAWVADQATLVFIHGAALDHSVWILQSRYFAHHGYNVLALDLPGHGRSAGQPLASIEAMADCVIQTMDAAGADRAALVGHSMGALVALEAAARYRERIQRCALLGVAVPMAVTDALLAAARANDPGAIDMITVWGHSPWSHIGGNRAPGLWLTGGGKRLLERAAPGVLFTALNACNEYRDGLARAAQVSCPTLLLLGRRDHMTPPRAARDLSAALPNTRSVVLARSGHMMFYEQPDETLDALIEFLAEPPRHGRV